MFYVAAKIFWLIAAPTALAILTGLLGLSLSFRFRRSGTILMGSAILGLAIGSCTPISALLLRPLEDRFPKPPPDLPEPTGIIVLGGALNTERSQTRGRFYLNDDAARLTAALELARRYPHSRLIFTGGSADLLRSTPPEAIGVRAFWLSQGMSEERMTFESNSRNTYENARFSYELLRPKPDDVFLLVTSAWHMPRSVGCFRQAGFTIVPYPVAYRTYGNEKDLQFSLPTLEWLSMLDLATREYIGLAAYWLTGKTNSLFPANLL
ncbi:MAG: YdcF family protein [Alphaproteobacteria bacterium]|nr:YdcF family protein [Alphaproteobacteria bacterium]MCL2452728.1 YdcF family protein [Alphaproteobacteria bacterium]